VNLAAGGLLFLTGNWDRPPVQLAPYQAQMTAGLLAAVASAAALFEGGPATVDLAKQEAVLALVTPSLTEYAYQGTVPAREGKVAAMARIERSADGWVYAGPGAAANADYATFSRFLEIPELGEERFLTADGRMANWEEHQRLVVPKLQERTTEEWLTRAEEWHLTFAPVYTATELLASDVLNERDFFAGAHLPQGEAMVPLAPYMVDGERPAALRTPLTDAAG
jgi:crotonobetainyl-CoA:carnitine CoA-transferase CaiB-like acyl-CoA transferase